MTVIEQQVRDKLQLIQKEKIWVYIVAFLAARVEVAGMHPFAVSIYLAAYLAECGSWGVYCAVLFGICSTLSVFSAIRYGALMLLITIGLALISGGRRSAGDGDRELYPLVATGFAGIMVIGYGIMYKLLRGNASDWYMSVLEGILTICFSLILRQACMTISTGKGYSKSESIVGILVLLAVGLSGVPVSQYFLLDILQLAAYYSVLALAYKFGSIYGICTGIVCGLVLAVRMQSLSWIATGVLLGVVIAFFRDWNRILTVAGYLAAIGLIGLLYMPELLTAASVRSVVVAAILYILTPKALLQNPSESETHDPAEIRGVQGQLQKAVNDRVIEYGKVFRKLGNSFREPVPVLVMGEECTNSSDIYEPSVSMTAPKYARQLQEIGNSLQEFSEAVSTPECMDMRLQTAVVKRFGKERVQIKEMLPVRGLYGRKELYISARTLRGRVMTTKEAARILSEVLPEDYRVGTGSRMIINRDYDVITFEEEVRYRYLMGARRHIKDGQQVSGDNFSQMELPNGQVLMLLADGMGSGENAAEQSEQLVDLLEDMLDAGFHKETAIRLLNELITVKSGGETFATLDLCMVDLYTGYGEFMKMGASITLIRRGSWVETIQSTSLPVGIQEESEIDIIHKKLYHGDMVVMVSDGLLDGLPQDNQEEMLREILLQITVKNPQEFADALLEKVEQMNPAGMQDDASVLVLGIWKK